MKRLNLNDIKSMNTVNLEKEQMQEVFGGRQNGGSCTLDTVTVTPSGSSNDGDDSFDGECSKAVATRSALTRG